MWKQRARDRARSRDSRVLEKGREEKSSTGQDEAERRGRSQAWLVGGERLKRHQSGRRDEQGSAHLDVRPGTTKSVWRSLYEVKGAHVGS